MLINAEASGWSSALHATADVSLQMSYYNEAFRQAI
uniref:Flagellar protein FliS n=1 Tax=Heterorhabditis bacteriophora TaxID=37862 RepID=A0A1I7W7J2_HETBA